MSIELKLKLDMKPPKSTFQEALILGNQAHLILGSESVGHIHLGLDMPCVKLILLQMDWTTCPLKTRLMLLHPNHMKPLQKTFVQY